MRNVIDVAFENGIFTKKYAGIIEIYPHKVTNTYVYGAAMQKLSETHDIVKITDNWLRAFERSKDK